MSGGKHFLQYKDFSREEFDYLFERTRRIKEKSIEEEILSSVALWAIRNGQK